MDLCQSTRYININQTALIKLTSSSQCAVWPGMIIYKSKDPRFGYCKATDIGICHSHGCCSSWLIKGIIDDIESIFVNQTVDSDFRLPVDASTFYSAFFAFVFPITTILHYQEWWCLIQCIWYLLGLPGGYLILLIYSAANLNSRSWGTREKKSDDNENMIIVHCKKLIKSFCACFRKRGIQTKQSATQHHAESSFMKFVKLIFCTHRSIYWASSKSGTKRIYMAQWMASWQRLLCKLLNKLWATCTYLTSNVVLKM